MKKDILVSIICITYNHEKYIKYALEGFLMQKTDFDYEILIHDDASTDLTASILREYEQNYPDKIKVIYQEKNQYSQGKTVSEILWKNAKGKYFAFCEGDDYWIDNRKLQKQVEFLEKNSDYIATYHNIRGIDKNNNDFIDAQLSFPLKLEQSFSKENYSICLLPGQLATLVCRNFYLEMLNDKLKFENYKANGDVKIAAYLIYKGKIKFFEEQMACYRRTYDSHSWNSRALKLNRNESFVTSSVELKRMIKDVFNIEIDISKKIEEKFLDSLAIFLNKPKRENFKGSFNIFMKSGLKLYLLKFIFMKSLKLILKSKEPV